MEGQQPTVLTDDHEINTDLDMREDIGAEIDDLLLLRVAGLEDEAQDLVCSILWRHLRHFPVFAEVADYVIESHNPQLQMNFLESINRDAITFTSVEEERFLRTILWILKGGSPTRTPWQDLEELLSSFDQWSLSVPCHSLEIVVAFLIWLEPSRDDAARRAILTAFYTFMQHQMVGAATRILSILTASAEKFSQTVGPKVIDYDIKRCHALLIWHYDGRAHADMLVANASCLEFLSSVMKKSSFQKSAFEFQCAFDDVERLLATTRDLLNDCFNDLHDPTPRGSRWEICERVESELWRFPTKEQILATFGIPKSIVQAATLPRGASFEEILAAHYSPDPDANSQRTPKPISVEAGDEPWDKIETYLTLNRDMKTSVMAPPSLPVSQPKFIERPERSNEYLERLPGILRGFLNQMTFEDVYRYCVRYPVLFREDTTRLHAITIECLGDRRRDVATWMVRYWIMLDCASSSPEGPTEWMRDLSQSRMKQTEFEELCFERLKSLEEETDSYLEAEERVSTITTKQPGGTSNIQDQAPVITSTGDEDIMSEGMTIEVREARLRYFERSSR